jgi:hypothetical protein
MSVWILRGRGSWPAVRARWDSLTKSQAASVREPHTGDLDLSPTDDALSLRLHGHRSSAYQIDE